jgi:flagellin
MAQIINTNTLSLLAQNNLNTSQSSLNTAIQRLSSGLRINSAKDDAAGQAIANRFTANIRGLTQAQRNANDGISIAQTTEGALKEINNNLQRVRELTVQAKNGTNSSSDLQSIQDEINSRLQEIDRVSEQTQFNGVTVLAKTQTMNIQVGANDGQTIGISLKEITTKTLGVSTFNVTGPKEFALSGNTAATATVSGLAYFTANYNVGTGGLGDHAFGGLRSLNMSFSGTTAIFQAAFGATTSISATSAVELSAGVLETRLGLAAGAITFDTSAAADANGNWYAAVHISAASTADFANLAFRGFDIDTSGSYTFFVALDPLKADTSASGTATFSIDTSKLSLTDLLSGGTMDAMATMDKALSTVDTLRSSLGAVQNRFDSVVANLGTTILNLSSSQSRIQDADYAVEVSNMTRAQILQQAGTSVLAQANQSTQGVLSLLR